MRFLSPARVESVVVLDTGFRAVGDAVFGAVVGGVVCAWLPRVGLVPPDHAGFALVPAAWAVTGAVAGAFVGVMLSPRRSQRRRPR